MTPTMVDRRPRLIAGRGATVLADGVTVTGTQDPERCPVGVLDFPCRSTCTCTCTCESISVSAT